MENKFQHNAVNTIYSTTDYSVFKNLNGCQRIISKQLIKSIVDSMNVQVLDIPILVNKYMQIIEGNHTFEARRKLKLPILYYIEPEYFVNEMRLLNIVRKNWVTKNILESFAKSDNDFLNQMVAIILKNKITSTMIRLIVSKEYKDRSDKFSMIEFVKKLSHLYFEDFVDIAEMERRIDIYKRFKILKLYNTKCFSIILEYRHILDLEHLEQTLQIPAYVETLNTTPRKKAKTTELFIDIYNIGLKPSKKLSAEDLK